MRKSILLLPLLVVGCSGNDDNKLRVWKGTTPKISVSILEKDIDPVLSTQHPDSFLTYLGNQDIEGIDDATKALLRNAGEPNQPWEGAGGAAQRKTLVETLQKVEAESKQMAGTEQHTKRIPEAVAPAARRASAEMVLARCLLEDGNSKGAADAMVQAIDWVDKMIFDAKTVPLWAQLHPIRERALKTAKLMSANPKLAASDLARISEAATKMTSNRKALAEAITRSFSNTILVPAYNVASLRTGIHVFQAVTKGTVDHTIAEGFAKEALKDHKTIYDPHDLAKISSDYAMGLIAGLDKPWPDCKKAIAANDEKSKEIWGFNPYDMNEAQFKDKALMEKTKAKLADVKSPNAYLHVHALMKDFVEAVPQAYAFDLDDSAIVAAIQKAVNKSQPGGGPLSTASDLVHDPITGQPFVMKGIAIKSPYVAVSDDPKAIKDAAAKAFPL